MSSTVEFQLIIQKIPNFVAKFSIFLRIQNKSSLRNSQGGLYTKH